MFNRRQLSSAAWRAVLVASATLHIGATDDELTSGAAVEGCAMGDAFFAPGMTVICADGCNECACAEDGQWASTLMACEPTYVQTCEEGAQSSTVVAASPLYHDGDKLAIAVQYRGGCLEHSWKLCASDASRQNLTGETRLWMVDTTPAHDTCYGLPTQEVVFDLTPIRERYTHTHPHGGSQTVMLDLNGETIAYSFE